MKILLMRHALAVGNAEGRMLGQLDLPLRAIGVKQAQRLAEFLAAHSWPPTHLYCSPLKRAIQTLEILQGGHPLPISALPLQRAAALLEINNGVLQGLTWQEAEQQQPELCRALLSSTAWLPIPGGESWQDCCDRTEAWVVALCKQHHSCDRLWIVSHGGILPYLIAAILGTEMVWQIENI
ncbi:MAG: histidine phosphatase family protein [Acaryochloridaceae cyanobacterium CSU_5_19]|nr:histidine phosphatase family protein [Acaryochloridaceae cyanobacterium CSU_5_19]